jgi:NAD+ synthetase
MDAEIPAVATQPAVGLSPGAAPSFTVALAQLDPTVGDVVGNLALIADAAGRAHALGARLVAFPRLALTGCHPGDLLDEPRFRALVEWGRRELVAASRRTPGTAWVVGLPLDADAPGERPHDGLVVLEDGRCLARSAAPGCNGTDGKRPGRFDPRPGVGPVLDLDGVRVGFLVSEEGGPGEGGSGLADPFGRLAGAGAELVVALDASPSRLGRREARHRWAGDACRRHGASLACVNPVGGQDQLVYDGASFLVDASGVVQREAARFEEDLLVARYGPASRSFLDDEGAPLPAVPADGLPRCEFYRRQIVLGLRDYARRCGFRQALVGSSGGLDSALTIALAAQALGPENVLAVTLPSVFSSAGSVDDSRTLCEALGVRLDEVPIAPIVDAFGKQLRESSMRLDPQGLTLENLQARVRGTLLMAVSNAGGQLLLNTGNKSELAVGYCTLYGDTNGGLGLLGDLYKTEVFELARHLNVQARAEIIPRAILDKPPSAELAPGQRDEDSLPPYPVLDAILKMMLEPDCLAQDELEEATGIVASAEATPEGRALVAGVRALVARSEYKRFQAPPVIQVRRGVFGSERRMPIAAVHNQSVPD